MKRLLVLFGLIICIQAQAQQPQLEAQEAWVDRETNELVIKGLNFDNGNVLEVTLGGVPLTVVPSADPAFAGTEIRATMPAMFSPGTYTVLITSGGGSMRYDEIDVTVDKLGAVVFGSSPTANDDMNAYSTGTVWIDTSAGNAYILVDGTPNAAVWKQITATEPKIYSIGDEGPAGGIVFYIADGGQHGLEASPVDQGFAHWGCADRFIGDGGAKGTAVGTGAQNTNEILAGCAEPNIAARKAAAYTLNGYDDWFLPSKDELNEMYLRRLIVGMSGTWYWSSSEAGSLGAWDQYIVNGDQSPTLKSFSQAVRAIRDF